MTGGNAGMNRTVKVTKLLLHILRTAMYSVRVSLMRIVATDSRRLRSPSVCSQEEPSRYNGATWTTDTGVTFLCAVSARRGSHGVV
jgi:hypothetical protein